MPWGVLPVSEIRLAFVRHVESLHVSVSEATLAAPPPFFQRAAPHELGQCDHKGFIEVGRLR